MSWILQKLRGYYVVWSNGNPLNSRPALNIIGGTVTDNPQQNRTDVDLSTLTASAIPASVGAIFGGINASVHRLVLVENTTSSAIPFAGARLWPTSNLSAGGGTNNALLTLITSPADLSLNTYTVVGQISTASVSWVSGQPLDFSGSGWSLPPGYVLALGIDENGTGQTLPLFSIRAR